MVEIRKVQRTGDMHYLYLPTSWCKEHHITSDSMVSITKSSEGSLIITPKLIKKRPKHVEINVSEDDLNIINKLIVGCYINPSDSFKINLSKALDYRKLLDQKRLVSVELVEIEEKGKTITCESSIDIGDPDMLLKTMVNKIKNMLVVMTKNPNKELILRYEEEIDRNRILIDKSVISSMTFKRESKLKTVDLFYISLLAKDIERIADHIILLNEKEEKFLEQLLDIISSLKNIIDIATEIGKRIDYKTAIEFSKKVLGIKEEKIKDVTSYYKAGIRHYLTDISEVIIDWSITNEIEESKSQRND
ncbi:MAG: hypothetical protein N3D84_00480 [Candidatus Woesearchaeota archaeon]|nr:hypothetical protein [Candidatus Woesearchaeota archaeon]